MQLRLKHAGPPKGAWHLIRRLSKPSMYKPGVPNRSHIAFAWVQTTARVLDLWNSKGERISGPAKFARREYLLHATKGWRSYRDK